MSVCPYMRMEFSNRFCSSPRIRFCFISNICIGRGPIANHAFIGISEVYTKPFNCVSFTFLGGFR